MKPTFSTESDLEIQAQELSGRPRREASPATQKLSLVWEGTQFRHHSLAVVNREICSRLIERGHDLAAALYEDHQFDSKAMPRFAALEKRFDRRCRNQARIRVRHQWPPSFEQPEEDIWVMIQPWEFGSVPREWIERMSGGVDELWVPSRYNRQCYIDGGLDPDRVKVIPNGVDLERFHPDVAPMKLATRKSTRFLFVGGTIPRKGVKVLLESFTSAFTAADDVCLIIKDVGTQGVYQGATAGDAIRAVARRPGAPEIHYIDRDLEQDELVSLYRAADVLVHPYHGEGFGMPILEAMACGLPVIVTGLGAALDFCNRDNAWLIPARRVDLPGRSLSGMPLTDQPWLAEPSPADLKAILVEVAASPAARLARGRAARAMVESQFDWEQVVDLIEGRLAALQSAAAVKEPALQLAPTGAEPISSPELDDIRALQVAFTPAVAALKNGEFEVAEKLFQELVANYSDLAAAHAGLGRVLLHSGRAEEACTALERALSILPGDPAASCDLASAEMLLGRHQAAEERLDALIAADDLNISARLLLARRYRDSGRVDEAAKLLGRALEIEPEHGEALRFFALVARDLRYREGFDRARDRLMRIAPKGPIPSWT